MSKPPSDDDIAFDAPENDDDWRSYRRFILQQLTSINKNQRITDGKVDEIRLYIAGQRGYVAAIATVISVAASAVVALVTWAFKKE